MIAIKKKTHWCGWILRPVSSRLGAGVALLWLVASSVGAQQELHLSPLTSLSQQTTSGPVIATAPGGYVYVFDRNPSGTQSLFYRSTDFGKTFEPPQALGGSDAAFQRLAASKTGLVVATWGDRFIARVSRDYGVTWDPPIILGRALSKHGMPAIDEQDRIHFFYRHVDHLDQTSLRTRRWVDGVLSSAQFITPPHPWHMSLDGVSVAGDGGVSVVGRRYFGPDFLPFVRCSKNHGQTWFPIVSFEGVEFGNAEVDVETAPGGYVYVVVTDRTDGADDIYLHRSVDYGRTFEPRIRLDTQSQPGTVNSWHVRLAADVTGNVYVAWKEYGTGAPPTRNEEVHLRRSSDFGETWGPPKVLSSGSAYHLVRLTANQSGHLFVQWESEAQPRRIKVNASRNYGETWLPQELDLGPRNTLFQFPKGTVTAIDDSGCFYMAWSSGTDMLFRAVRPTLGISIVPKGDVDGVVLVPEQGQVLEFDIALQNHHPTDPVTGLHGILEFVLPDGRVRRAFSNPAPFQIPVGGSRAGSLLKNLGPDHPPGLYELILGTDGGLVDTIRFPILKTDE